MSSSKARIRLFGAERFVPRVPADAEVLGVIERQMQIGALVRGNDGAYWQVNGDVSRQLNRSMVERALRAARLADRRQWEVPTVRKAQLAITPVITVRRRRTICKPAAAVEP